MQKLRDGVPLDEVKVGFILIFNPSRHATNRIHFYYFVRRGEAMVGAMKAAVQKQHIERVESGKPSDSEAQKSDKAAGENSKSDDGKLEAEAEPPKVEGDVSEPTGNVGEEGNEEAEEECPDQDEEVALEDERDVD